MTGAKPYRAAIIGCGSIGRAHARGYTGVERTELAACADIGMRYVLGDPDVEWIFAQVERKTDRYERSVRCEDCIAGHMRFAGGVQGSFQTDLVEENKWAFVQGSEGMIDFDDGWARYFNAHTGGWHELELEAVEPMAAQVRELVEWIEGRCVHRGQSSHGMWTMHMMMGAYESARCHERVGLPLQTRANPLDLMVESGQLPVERPGRYDVRSQLLSGEALTLEELLAAAGPDDAGATSHSPGAARRSDCG